MIEVGADVEIQAAAFDVSCSRCVAAAEQLQQPADNRATTTTTTPPPEPRAGAADRLLLSDLEHVEALPHLRGHTPPSWLHQDVSGQHTHTPSHTHRLLAATRVPCGGPAKTTVSL